MRLDKCLTENLAVSRKDAGKLIKQGKVCVNGIVVKDSAYKVALTDELTFMDEKLHIKEEDYKAYYMLNKPKGYVCASDDSLNPYVIALFKDEYKARELFCVGRLDIDTTGLLLVTNDGLWSHKITSPKHHVSKVYRAFLADPCPIDAIDTFKEGIVLKGESSKTKSAKLTIINQHEVLLEITEGKYHQVKRMFAAIGNKVEKLERLTIGGVSLDKELKPGEFRKLTQEELKLLGVGG